MGSIAVAFAFAVAVAFAVTVAVAVAVAVAVLWLQPSSCCCRYLSHGRCFFDALAGWGRLNLSDCHPEG